LAAGAEYLLKNGAPGPPWSFDIQYYCRATSVFYWRGGRDWTETWNPTMRDWLVSRQEAEGKPGAGSWSFPGNGDLFGTLWALLSLEVYYRYPPDKFTFTQFPNPPESAKEPPEDKPGAPAAGDALFAWLSDAYSVNGRAATLKKDSDAVARLLKSDNADLRRLVEDAVELAELRLKAKVTYDLWKRAATDPTALRAMLLKRVVEELPLPDTPENNQKFADDIADALRLSGPNDARVRAVGQLLVQLDKVQAVSVPPVLRERFPNAAADGRSVELSAALEPGKLPAEMTLVNKGTKPLHNVILWFYLEAKPPAGLSAEEMKGLAGAYLLGGRKFAVGAWRDRQLQDRVMALGSRNMVYVPLLNPDDKVRVTYELGSVRGCKRAVFSLYSEELKVADQAIQGIKEMQAEIERMFGGAPR
jgi:hypothetical protein